MSVTEREQIEAEGELVVHVLAEGDSCVIRAFGELDLMSRHKLLSLSAAGDHPAMVIDLAGLTFMDCSGYQSLVASRSFIESGGRTLTIRGETGQPARVLELIASVGSIGPSDE